MVKIKPIFSFKECFCMLEFLFVIFCLAGALNTSLSCLLIFLISDKYCVGQPFLDGVMIFYIFDFQPFIPLQSCLNFLDFLMLHRVQKYLGIIPLLFWGLFFSPFKTLVVFSVLVHPVFFSVSNNVRNYLSYTAWGCLSFCLFHNLIC